MISWAYIKYFLPVLSKRHEINELYVPQYTGIDPSIIFGLMFFPFPVLIFWVLAVIVCTDPGFTTQTMQSALLKKYGFVEELIDREYKWLDILAIMTEHYLIDQGIMKPHENSYKYTHSSRVIQDTEQTGTSRRRDEIELNMMQQDSPTSGSDDIEKQPNYYGQYSI